MVKIPFFIMTTLITLSVSSCDGNLSWFSFLATVNSAATKKGVLGSLRYIDFKHFQYMTKNGISGSYHSSLFRFLRNLSVEGIMRQI